MQKCSLALVTLLLTLIFGPAASAWTAGIPTSVYSSSEASTTESLHLVDQKPFEQVGDVYVKIFDENLASALF